MINPYDPERILNTSKVNKDFKILQLRHLFRCEAAPRGIVRGRCFLLFDLFNFEELTQEKTKDFRAFNDDNFHEKDPLNLN